MTTWEKYDWFVALRETNHRTPEPMKEHRLITTDGFEKSAPLHELLNEIMGKGFTLRKMPNHFAIYDAEGEHAANIYPVY